MTKLYLILPVLILSACAGSIDTRPAGIINAENYSIEGLQAFSQADWQRAQSLFTQSLIFYQGIDDQQGALLSHINLAEVALVMGDYPAVEKHLFAAGLIAHTTGQPDIQSRIALLYAQNALAQNQVNVAKKFLKPLLAVDEHSASQVQIIALADRTKAAFMENIDSALWTRRYAQTLSLADVNDSNLESRLLRFQAELLREQGDIEAAERCLQQALTGYKQHLSRPGIAITLSELGQLYISQGRWYAGKEYISRSLAVFRHLKNTEKITQLNAILVEIDMQLNKVKAPGNK
ncbi:hypothetical protein [Methyloprofundus sp.]|uniref:hypothetical protein n=1 Tax=Methyloprofundus sp. TaxID=2020875 RepID=UPI003D112BFF